MSSERAGTPTHGRLDRDKAKQILQSIEGVDEYNWPERLGPYLDALEACVVPDPRWVEVDDLNDFRQPDRTGRALVEYGGPNIVHVYVPADQ